jgi:LysM repeat protein
MKRFVLFLFIVFSLQTAIAQDDYQMIRHQVQLGETVRMISRKYKIEPAEIYRLNKFAVDGISHGQVLQLFVPKKEMAGIETNSSADTVIAQNDEGNSTSTSSKTVTTTTVRKKKTEDNDPVSEDVATVNASGDLGEGSAVTHTVSRGETLSGIAKKYGISIDDVKSQNEKVLKRGLQPGQVLAIIRPTVSETISSYHQSDETVTEATTTESSSQTEIKHKVEKGDTLFQLAKKYNVSVDDIRAQNESLLKKGLQIGQVLTITTTN